MLFVSLVLVSSKKYHGYGVLESNQADIQEMLDSGEWVMAPKISEKEAQALPTSFDAAEAWPMCASLINDIRDQSNCGCCWAFGAAEAASDRMCIASNGTVIVPLSSESLCFCSSSNGCGGGSLTAPWNYILSHGLVSGDGQGNGTFDQGFCSNFGVPNSITDEPHCLHHGPAIHTCGSTTYNDPYPAEGTPGCPSQKSQSCPKSCDSSSAAPHNNYATDKYSFIGKVTVLPNDADTIANALMTSGPIEVDFNVFADFEDYTCGIYKQTSVKYLGGHAVKLVGWGVENGVDYWKIANSWNPYWGEGGFFRIVKGVNECGIETGATSSPPNAQWVTPNGLIN